MTVGVAYVLVYAVFLAAPASGTSHAQVTGGAASPPAARNAIIPLNDPAYADVKTLMRTGIIVDFAGYGDATGSRGLTRCQFADGLDAC